MKEENIEKELDHVLSNRRLRRNMGIKLSPRELLPKIGRNEPCPCGSNKKFKIIVFNSRSLTLVI